MIFIRLPNSIGSSVIQSFQRVRVTATSAADLISQAGIFKSVQKVIEEFFWGDSLEND